jgi:glutathionylspermidine synthase
MMTNETKKEMKSPPAPPSGGKIKGKKKPKWPKQMTIRYDKKQEEEIEKMMAALHEKTMSKAFLKCPGALMGQSKVIEAQNNEINVLREKLYKLEEMAESFNEFNKRLKEFVEKKK